MTINFVSEIKWLQQHENVFYNVTNQIQFNFDYSETESGQVDITSTSNER